MKKLLGILACGCGIMAMCVAEAAPRGGGRPGPAPGGGPGAAGQRGPLVGQAGPANSNPAARLSEIGPAGDRRVSPGNRPAPLSSPREAAGALQQHLGIQTLSGEQALKREATARQWSGHTPQPFTPAWYAQHPSVWHATHPHADLFAAVAIADLTHWLAVPVVAAYPVAAVETTSVAVTPPESTATPVDSQGGSTTPSPQPQSEWLPLGVFDLKPSGAADASWTAQLAVDHSGNIRGSSYDLLGGQTEPVIGTIDKAKLTATWMIGENGKVTFHCPLAEFTKPEGQITALGVDGRARTWEIRRRASEKPAAGDTK